MNKNIILPVALLITLFTFIQCKNETTEVETTNVEKTEVEKTTEKETQNIETTKKESLVPKKQKQLNQTNPPATNTSKPAIQSPWLNSKVNKESLSKEDKLAASNLKELPNSTNSPLSIKEGGNLPKISRLISKEKIGRLVGVDATQIIQKEMNNKQTPGKLKSSFYKWKEPGNEDAGIFIQIQSNPVGEELPNWAEKYMESKYNSGEMTYPSDGNTYRYTKIGGIGEEAAFCHELKKVIWRPNDQIIVTVADNYNVSDNKRISNAKEIAAVLNPQLNL